MKVMHVAETVKGGVETYLKNIIYLQIRDDSVSGIVVVSPVFDVPNGVSIVPVDGHRGFVTFLKLLICTLSKLLSYSPDVVHFHGTFSGVLRLFLAPFLINRRVIYCSHGWAFNMGVSNFKKYLYSFSERLLSSFCNVVAVISEYEYKTAIHIGISHKKLFVIHNSTNDSLVYHCRIKNKNRKFKVLFVGRFDRQKGFDIFLDTISCLDKHADQFEFNVVGDYVIQSPTQDISFPDNAVYHGWLSSDEIDNYYLDSDIVIMPSRWEGFGLVAIEAMKNGTPVLTSGVQALSEHVVDGFNGYICPDNNGPSYASKLLYVAKNRGLLEEMRANARSTYENKYTNLIFSARLKQLYTHQSTT